MLSNCIFDVLKNNKGIFFLRRKSVVICFQIVSLTYWKTTNRMVFMYSFCCDLLSNCIFDVLKNNLCLVFAARIFVVICFQIVSLTYWKTTTFSWFNLFRCCDLLSNCIFDVLKNNNDYLANKQDPVVICFQIVSLTYWKTTIKTFIVPNQRLWFAFKLYLWRIEKQHRICIAFAFASCDLLSNCIFDVLKNNVASNWCGGYYVVICFQIVSLTYWKTTSIDDRMGCQWLWFAFKLYLWRIEKQLNYAVMRLTLCCDLLSNCIFDVLKNNKEK